MAVTVNAAIAIRTPQSIMKVWLTKSTNPAARCWTSPARAFHRPRLGQYAGAGQPLVSRRHAVVKLLNGELQLENVGLNSCLVGETEVLGARSPPSSQASASASGPFH
jgi:hypothetical protein